MTLIWVLLWAIQLVNNWADLSRMQLVKVVGGDAMCLCEARAANLISYLSILLRVHSPVMGTNSISGICPTLHDGIQEGWFAGLGCADDKARKHMSLISRSLSVKYIFDVPLYNMNNILHLTDKASVVKEFECAPSIFTEGFLPKTKPDIEGKEVWGAETGIFASHISSRVKWHAIMRRARLKDLLDRVMI